MYSLSYKGFGIPLETLTTKELEEIKTELSVRPIVVQGYGSEPEAYPMYRINTKKIYLPKYYALEKYTSLIKPEQTNSTPSVIKNTERTGIKLSSSITFSGTLRPYQTVCVGNTLNNIAKNDSCVLDLFTGAGKTACALYIITCLKLKTLILVHKVFLMEQFKERITQFIPNARIGTIQGSTFDTADKDIVIGMIQSISMKDYDTCLFDDFGFVVIDECFTYDQLIVTETGPVKIGTLYEMWASNTSNNSDIKVLSYNETKNCMEYKKITYAWEKHNKNLLEIKYGTNTNTNPIQCTENHKILTPDGYIEANKLKVGSTIVCSFKVLNEYYHRNVKVESIESIKNPDKKNRARVYDIEVEDNHNFVLADGLRNDCGPIVHNCHHICSKIFSRTLFKVSTKKMLGLSATPTRKDGLTKVLNWFLGPIITYKQQSQDNMSIPVVKIIPAEYENNITIKYNFRGSVMVPNLINQISTDPKRNRQIIDQIIDCHTIGRNILVLSDRRCQCLELKQLLEIKGYTDCGVYLGGMSTEALEESNKTSIILATYSMASEAYDNPKLDTLIFATGKNDIIQACGRILRKKNKHDPLIIDIADMNYQPSQYKKRKMYYKKQKFIIEEIKDSEDDDEDDDNNDKTSSRKLQFRDDE
jgi:superfamily II DNA or RNA helicase